MLYSSKSTFLTFSSQIPTNSVNLTKFLPFPYMRNIEYLRGTLSSHENYHIPTMRNGKTTEILSSLLWDSHKILWGIFVRDAVHLQLQHCCNITLQYHALCEWCLWQPYGMKESLCNLLRFGWRDVCKHTLRHYSDWETILVFCGDYIVEYGRMTERHVHLLGTTVPQVTPEFKCQQTRCLPLTTRVGVATIFIVTS